MHYLLQDIGVVVLAATVIGLAAHLLRQPIILGYLVAGALIGPELGVGWVKEQESIDIISEMGLILLLFVIGLELNVKALLASGRQLLIAGFGQFPACALLGVALFGLLGYGLKGSHSDGLYLALMCSLSSTAVVVKLLYDKSELDTLPGRMTVGILVIQDIFAIFILAFQPNFANPTIGPVLKAIGGTVGLLAAGFLFSRYALGWVFHSIAKAPEMVVATSIGWCAAVAGLAGGLGLSKEMGALIAGLSIAAFPYSIHVTAKTLPLRDFFLTLFFMSLGMKITAPRWDTAMLVGVMVGFTISSRFLTAYPMLIFSGAGRRTAFISSLNLAQISEFSLVIGSLGIIYKHIQPGTVAATIYAMAISAVLSSYAIRYSHPLYLAFDRLMARLGRGGAAQSDTIGPATRGDPRPITILGFHRVGQALVEAAERHSPALLRQMRVIDFNPEKLKGLNAKGVTATFGDISSHDTLEHAHLHDSRLILCTIPDMLLKGTDNQTLVQVCRTIAPRAQIVVTADDPRHEHLLRREGAHAVLNPHNLAAEQIITLASSVMNEAEAAADKCGHETEPKHDGDVEGAPSRA